MKNYSLIFSKLMSIFMHNIFTFFQCLSVITNHFVTYFKMTYCEAQAGLAWLYDMKIFLKCRYFNIKYHFNCDNNIDIRGIILWIPRGVQIRSGGIKFIIKLFGLNWMCSPPAVFDHSINPYLFLKFQRKGRECEHT